MFSSRSPAGQAAQRLAGHRIEIAAAASGIDKAAAQLFMAEGARVALLDLLGSGLTDMLAGADSFSGAVDITGEPRWNRPWLRPTKG
jgi:NAD(P)-dependent dehydrogenase (short-subunit alcohol dehydrogenase family)